jgi:polysaccharide deacetylase family protein (PEP-CTERM system associated)
MTRAPVNALTVDVEDFFHVQAFAGVIPRTSWDGLPRRVEANTERLLELCDRAGVAGTFFTLGWVAARHPALVRRIVAAGHELASHGFGHQRVDTQTPDEFRADILAARRLLEDVGGVPVTGYRAPTFSLGPRTPWAFEILAGAGYRYSSSIYPVRHDLYGSPDAPREPYRHAGTEVWEFPMTTLRVASQNLPCSGGGYFRLLPYPLYRFLLRRCNAAQGTAALFYTHPWEIDPAQPRVAGAGRLARFRHYHNLAKTLPRLERLLSDFAWDRMDRVYAALLTPAGRAA